MHRYKLFLEYDGSNYVGWQRQDNGPSIQAALEAAIEAFCGDVARTQAAGRTDAGVHALAMVVHVDLTKPHAPDVVRDAINQHLKPAPIAVLRAVEIDADFHARFSCVRRAYEYRIINRRAPLTLDKNRAWRVTPHLDVEKMDQAAQALVGKHDFTTFRAAQCQSETPVKSLEQISVMRAGDDVVIRCAARSFLHHQVRSFTGSLVEVGRGKWGVNEVKKALEAKDRKRCGPVAPPDGLYFMRADYESAP
ncbi:MAG: tRNA pseudouridine synthase A [Hyphococcus sp.]|nr:MAG: tRNA pseudouridine synthase A [Marinicaulis sp.]